MLYVSESLSLSVASKVIVLLSILVVFTIMDCSFVIGISFWLHILRGLNLYHIGTMPTFTQVSPGAESILLWDGIWFLYSALKLTFLNIDSASTPTFALALAITPTPNFPSRHTLPSIFQSSPSLSRP